MNAQADLFHRTKEQQLMEWCQSKGYFSKAQIMQWGLDNFYIRADRTIRDFVQEGLVKKLDKDEVLFRGLSNKMGWYQCA